MRVFPERKESCSDLIDLLEKVFQLEDKKPQDKTSLDYQVESYKGVLIVRKNELPSVDFKSKFYFIQN